MSSDTLSSLTPEQQQARRQLRAELRRKRRALTPGQQKQAARGLARQLERLPGMARAKDIAAYVASDGEIDPGIFLRKAMKRGVRVWLPVLTRRPSAGEVGMHFARMPASRTGRAGWQRNQFGIAEPRNRTRMAAWKLDALLMPLVGFDARGQRLGMGGGFYDRLLAGLAQRPCRPLQVALAHDIQRTAVLPVAAWDQPADAVITTSQMLRTRCISLRAPSGHQRAANARSA